jgi:hypothetical protein
VYLSFVSGTIDNFLGNIFSCFSSLIDYLSGLIFSIKDNCLLALCDFLQFLFGLRALSTVSAIKRSLALIDSIIGAQANLRRIMKSNPNIPMSRLPFLVRLRKDALPVEL